MQIKCKRHGVQDLVFYRADGVIKRKCETCYKQKQEQKARKKYYKDVRFSAPHSQLINLSWDLAKMNLNTRES